VRLRTWLEDDPTRWDAFVETAAYRSFSQLWKWGELRREGGWTPVRLAVGDADAENAILAGAQLMVRRVPLFGTALAYAPRGPVGALDDDGVWSELVAGLRRVAVAQHVATVRIEPEAATGSPVAQRLQPGIWRQAPANQPVNTRIVDLTRSEEELRADLRKKHRQYVAKAERAGLRVERFDRSSEADEVSVALTDFHRILLGTGERAGFNTRPLDYYRNVWNALAPANRVRLYFAAREGDRLATLFHITCGDHAAELYGGANADGTEVHANYLVKWAAMLGFKEEGFATYDLWGEPTAGIAHFKEGFGGKPIELVGARDLVVNRAGDLIVRAAVTARDQLSARSRGRPHPAGSASPSAEGFREATEADAAAWQALLERTPSGDVLHDWEWAAVARLDGTPARRFVLEEGGELVAIVSAQVRRTSLGRSFWYVPRGPVMDYDHAEARARLERVVNGLHAAAKADRAIAVRIEPRVERDSSAAALFDAIGLPRLEATLQTPDTRLVELLPDDDALLATFDKDTRYAIRRAEREGVVTGVIGDPNDETALADLHGLVTETLDRANYRLPSLERYRAIWRGLAIAGRARIIQARHGDALEATGLLVVEGDRSIYLYAGSIREAKGETKRYPSYAAQWQMMRTARDMGSKVHDLWGVAPEDAGPDHPWYGYSLFKKGFGGRFVSWAGSWDLVVDPMMYRLRGAASRVRIR
jgi:peptidoglycan pentaglycine glycine transferase (the first glycine)